MQRFATLLLAIFAFLALALAVVGIYAVMSFIVAQRTREIGIRIALGARPDQVVKLLVRQGLRITAVGVAVGIAAALALSYLAARRATRIDPMTALRVE